MKVWWVLEHPKSVLFEPALSDAASKNFSQERVSSKGPHVPSTSTPAFLEPQDLLQGFSDL